MPFFMHFILQYSEIYFFINRENAREKSLKKWGKGYRLQLIIYKYFYMFMPFSHFWSYKCVGF